MIRSPEIRYTGATTADVLAQKPTGYNYDLCPGALAVCGRTRRRRRRPTRGRAPTGPFPPASDASDPPFLYSGAYCARNGTHNVTNLAGTGPLTTNGNANNHQHWTQVYCGHEIQINETLTGGGPQPSGDPIKTGSVYGFRNLNAKQSRTYERLDKGVWHDMEIRTIGQQYTVLIDGELINQFDNSVPKIASRNGDPPTMARQFAQGYLGLQTHGGNDRISYREIQVKDLEPSRHPGQRRASRGGRPRSRRAAAHLRSRRMGEHAGRRLLGHLVPLEPDRARPSALPRPEPARPRELHHPGRAGVRHAEPDLADSLVVGQDRQYTPTAADVGKVIHCAVNANNGGATVWETARAPEITARD